MKLLNISLVLLVIILAWICCPVKSDAAIVTLWGACVIGLWLTVKTNKQHIEFNYYQQKLPEDNKS